MSSSVVLYDRNCPLCRLEMQRLKVRDREGRLFLLDINSRMFDESLWGISFNEASSALHVLTSNNQWLVGMPAVRHVYRQVGLGWLVAATAWPVLSRLSDFAYKKFAPNRFVISRWMGLGGRDIKCSEQGCLSTHNHGGES